MADYTIISDITTHLVGLLREKMASELVSSASQIEAVNPIDANQDYLLGVYLYDMRMEGDISKPQLVDAGRSRLVRPPRPYRLYYMIYVNPMAQMAMREYERHKLISRAAQVLNDSNVVNPRTLQPWLELDEPPIAFVHSQLTLEEKTRVWASINKPYRLSLFYRAAPVYLSSEIAVEIRRVTDATFNLGNIMEADPHED